VTRTLVVLAGGRGERLGGIVKPLLVRPDGRTLIEHLIATLGPLVDDTMIVAPAGIAPLFAGRVVEDPGEGPGLALGRAVREARGEHLLLVAGDHVAPSAELAERLLAAAGDTGAIVSIEGVLQPAFAAFSTRALARIDPPPRSLTKFAEAIDPVVIDARTLDPELLPSFADVDTEADLSRWGLSTEGVPTWSHLAGRPG
jgi:molybdopterin-guanine dinucleotide biosynthesis protein A